ncbi:MAG TPA: hypothetical protein PLG50_09405, partial [bacterium]|nr:hypothetical protein [bacterium]
AFGSFVRTRVFQLTGLPQTFAKGLTLSMRYQGNLKDSSFVVLATPMDSPEGDSTLLSYSFFPARDSSGMMVCTIPPRSRGLARSRSPMPGSASQQDDLFDLLFGISEYDIRYYGHVAVMKCPKIMLESLTSSILMVPYLSAEKVRSMGLPYLEPEGLYEMEVVEFKALSPSAPLYALMNFAVDVNTLRRYQLLQLNYDKMAWQDRAAICRQTAREFFYRVPAFYHKGTMNPEKYMSKEHVWLHAAIGSWFEEWLPPEEANFIPTGLRGSELQIFDGLMAGGLQPGRNMRIHGYTLAPLIKYLVTHYRESAINRIYDGIAAGMHPAEALAGSMADPPRVWWPDFIRRYLAGEFYAVPNQTFLTGVAQTFQFRSASDTKVSYTDNYYDLSARLYRIDLEYAEVPAGTEMEFALSTSASRKGNANLMLFGINGGKLEYWTQGDTVNVARIRELTQAGYDILAVVISSNFEEPYTRSNSITLDVRLTRPVFTTARIKTRTQGTTAWYDGTTTSGLGILYADDRWHDGTFTDDTFQASWNITTTDPAREGHLTIRLDHDSSPRKLVYFELREISRGSSEIQNWAIISKPDLAIAGEVPYYSSTALVFDLKGQQACAALAAVENRLEGQWGYWWELTSFSCDEQSYVQIILE